MGAAAYDGESMAWLIWIGPNPENLGGESAKGFHVWRRGSTVRSEWGPVESLGARGGKRKWLGRPQRHEWPPFPSEIEAAVFVQRKIEEKCREGYDEMTVGTRIHPK